MSEEGFPECTVLISPVAPQQLPARAGKLLSPVSVPSFLMMSLGDLSGQGSCSFHRGLRGSPVLGS